ncbi:hypothetical protein Efla_004864 [Eimeria flavescens]
MAAAAAAAAAGLGGALQTAAPRRAPSTLFQSGASDLSLWQRRGGPSERERGPSPPAGDCFEPTIAASGGHDACVQAEREAWAFLA